MAVTVVFDGTRIDDAEALSPAGGNVWTDTSGKAASLEPDFVYQNSNSVSEKVGTSPLGVALDTAAGTPASFDMTTPQVFIAKVIATNSGVLNNKGASGGIIEIGSAGIRGNYDEYYVVGGDTYPIKGGWLIIPIDPNGGNQSARPGTAPTVSAIDYFGWQCDFSASSKSQNVAMDAVDIVPNGSGLTMTGGTPDGDFADFVSIDEGTVTNRWGIVSTQNEALFVTGVLTIGTATATQFTDSNAVVIFPEAEFLNTVGFFGVKFGLQSASTTIDITNTVFNSVGTAAGTVDTRPDYTVTGTSGALTFTSNTINTFRNITLTSGATMSACNLIAGNLVTQAGGTITNCNFSAGTGTHYVLASNPTLITSDFVQGASGHAVRCDTIGTYDWGNTDSGYTGTRGTNAVSSTGSTDAMFYNNSGGLITLNVTGTGQSPSVRNGAGATTTVNSSVPVTFEAVDTADAAIQNVRVTAYLISDDSEVVNALTNASGIVSTTFSGGTPADYYYRFRKSSAGATKYVNLSGFATIESSTGSSVKRSMVIDTKADPTI